MDSQTNHGVLVDRIVAWAEGEPNVVAVVMTGSRARIGAIVDEFSDYDIEIIAVDPTRLAADHDWFESFGDLWVCPPLAEDQGDPGFLVIYAEGKVDLALCGRDRVSSMVRSGTLDSLYERGYQVLLDKEGLTRNLPRPSGAFPQRALPAEDQFIADVQEFWFEAAHMPKYLARDELWVVKFRDWTMKELLLQMLEWHAVATRKDATDVWHIGVGMKEWVGAETWQQVHSVFARFDGADSWRGLLATVALYRRLSAEVAVALGYPYPAGIDESITGYIESFESQTGSRKTI